MVDHSSIPPMFDLLDLSPAWYLSETSTSPLQFDWRTYGASFNISADALELPTCPYPKKEERKVPKSFSEYLRSKGVL